MNTPQRVSDTRVLEDGVLKMKMFEFLYGDVEFITVLLTKDKRLMRQFLELHSPNELEDVEL